MISVNPDAYPSDLVPGDLDLVEKLLGDLTLLSKQIKTANARLRSIDLTEWKGGAGKGFSNVVGGFPARLDAAAESAAEAARSLRKYHGALVEALTTAQHSIELSREAQTASHQWSQQGAVGSDPGDLLRRRAAHLAERAQADSDAAAESAAASLDSLTANVPQDIFVQMRAVPTASFGDISIAAHDDHPLARPDDFVADPGEVTTQVRYGSTEDVGFVGDRSESWAAWESSGDSRSVGDVASTSMAALGVVGLGAVDRRTRRTAMRQAGIEPSAYRSDTSTVPQPRSGRAGGPSRTRGPEATESWRTNLRAARQAAPAPSVPLPRRPVDPSRIGTIGLTPGSVIRHEGAPPEAR